MIPEAFDLQTAEEKMSEQIDPAPAQGAENAESSVTEEKPAETTSSTTAEVDAAQVKTPMKKVKSKKDLKNDPNRFELPGVNFNAKLIGIDDVESARGDKMCQEAMHKLKIAVKTSGQHKQRVIVNVSLDGIRIIDLRTQTTHHSHPVHRISFISRDLTDGRAFGYVFGAGEGKHKFFAIKTEKAAEALVLTLRDLFQVVYDLKKKEMEEAKHKVEEKAEEAKEEEPVYQVPNKAVPVENGTVPAGDSNVSTYEVPPNNAPVNDTSKNLLVLETEMEAIEKRIEEINTMDELFKELEAPPVTTATSSSSGGSWSSDLAGLSSPAQPAFTMGGGPVPGSQPFMQQPGFPAQNMQPGVMNAPFGTAPQQGNPMGNPGFGGQPAQANPFQAPPTVPARPGLGFPGQQPVGFPQAQQPGPGFPGTPFPGFQQPGFPPVPQRGGPSPQPVINVQPPNDPFGSDPFQTGGTEFEEGILTPAKLETQAAEQAEQPKKKDVFEDLVNIGTKTEPTKSPKDLFVDLSAPPKVSLNQMKSGNRTPSPKPPSPFGNQASRDDSSPSTVSNVSRTSAPAVCDDPFANDPFALSTSTVVASSFSNIQSAQQTDHIAQPFVNDAEVKGDIFSDDDFNLPSPEGPPPPLPDDIISHSINVESHIRPEPPPRPVNTHQTPPLPPRPRSSQSDSVKNISVNESPSVNHLQTPPLPPRPRITPDAIAVPRPKPRSFSHKDLSVNEVKKSSFVNSDAEIKSDKDLSSRNERMTRNSNITKFKDFVEPKCETASKNSVPKNSWTPSVTSPKIADPFESTDPFATDDPFTQADPFSGDPFAADPFSEPVLTNNTQPYTSNDPFTSVVASPKSTTANSDPFSVFDKAFTSDSFKFDRTSVKKVKLKGTAN